MTSAKDVTASCVQRAPDRDALLSLLDESFGGWGSMEYLEWKYDQFPRYNPAEHNFIVTDGTGELIGARRIFERSLQQPNGEPLTAHVHGGTAVHPDHRGSGHYSEMLQRSRAYSRQHADCLFTFNRAGKITTEHHQENGWDHLVLPVFVKLLSPAKVAAEHIFEHQAVESLADVISNLDTHLTKFRSVSRAVARSARVAYGDRREGLEQAAAPTTDCSIDVVAGPEGGTAGELAARLATLTDSVYQFERSPRQLRHAMSYPSARLYLATRDRSEALLGFVIAGQLEKDGFSESRILEQCAVESGVLRRLMERVETDARQLGSDVVALCSNVCPSNAWVALGTEYLMWPPGFSDVSVPNSRADWRVTALDIL